MLYRWERFKGWLYRIYLVDARAYGDYYWAAVYVFEQRLKLEPTFTTVGDDYYAEWRGGPVTRWYRTSWVDRVLFRFWFYSVAGHPVFGGWR